VQAPVLQKYGLPPNAQGIDRMKHAVHRRVAEGACRLELLATKLVSSLAWTQCQTGVPALKRSLQQSWKAH
jgi:hypothetical protein